MSDDEFRKLCNVYGFAPSRALRELLDCAMSQVQRKPLSGEQLRQIELGLRIYYDNGKYDLSLHDFARAIERAHGIGEQP